MKKKEKKGFSILVLLLLLVGITVGFSTLSQQLIINGTSKIEGNTWKVDPNKDTIVCPTGEVCTTNPTNPTEIEPDNGEGDGANGAIIWMDGDTVYFKHLLEKPGDTFTFTVDFANNGSIDAKIEEFSISELNTTAAQFLTYEVKRVTTSGDVAVAAGTELAAGKSHTFRVTVTFKDDVEVLPTESELTAINGTDGKGAASSFTVKYVQK